MSRTALIAGASGLVGGFCLRQLLLEPSFGDVVAIVRKPVEPHARLRQIAFDAEAPSMPGGVAFCALGTTIRKAGSQEAFRKVDYEAPLRIARAARTAGASCFVLVSSIGADERSSNFYLRVKGELESAIEGLAFPSLHIFQPSILMGDRPENRTGERIGIAVAKALQFALAGPLSKYRPIQASDVGKAMAKAAVRDQSGKHFYQWREIIRLLA